MSKFIGRLVETAIGLESSRGVGVTPTYSLGKTEFSLYDKTVDVRDDSSIGRIEDSNDRFTVEKYAQGALGGILGANSAAYLMALALGSISTGSTSDSRTTHTPAVLNSNQHKSASLLVKDPNQTLIHKLVMLNSLELTVNQEEFVRFNAEFMSKRGITSTKTIPTYVEDYKFTKRKAKVQVASAVGGLAAASKLAIKSLTLTITKNLTKDSVITTAEPVDFQNGPLSIEGELVLNWNDQTYKNYMLDGTYRAMRIFFESEKLIGATSYGDLTLDLAKVDFFGWEPDAANPDIVPETINFKANYDLTNGLVYAATVRNALATL